MRRSHRPAGGASLQQAQRARRDVPMGAVSVEMSRADHDIFNKRVGVLHEVMRLLKEAVVRGEVRWKRRHVISVEATVALADGTLLASAEGSFVSRGPMGKERFGVPDRPAESGAAAV